LVDVVVKMKFSINKYSHVFNRAGPGYGGMSKFINIDQYIAFPRQGYNFNFADAEFHTVSIAPTLHRVYVRLKKIAVLRRFNGSVDFDIVRKSRYLERATALQKSSINTMKGTGPRTEP
jgi:hypothetical protein